MPLGLERPLCPPSPGDLERGVITFKAVVVTVFFFDLVTRI